MNLRKTIETILDHYEADLAQSKFSKEYKNYMLRLVNEVRNCKAMNLRNMEHVGSDD